MKRDDDLSNDHTEPGARTDGARRFASWALAAAVAVSCVVAIALTLYAAIGSWQPGQRVAQAPALSVERVMPRASAGRQSDDTRVFAR